MAELMQKVNRHEKSICGKCSHRFVCFGIDNQPCFECNRFEEEVVRCTECRYSEKNGGDCSGVMTIHSLDPDIGLNIAHYVWLHYCSYGERRTDDRS